MTRRAFHMYDLRCGTDGLLMASLYLAAVLLVVPVRALSAWRARR